MRTLSEHRSLETTRALQKAGWLVSSTMFDRGPANQITRPTDGATIPARKYEILVEEVYADAQAGQEALLHLIESMNVASERHANTVG